jgi:SAM-dependent methyltransferase
MMRQVNCKGKLQEGFRPWVIDKPRGLIGTISYYLRLLIDTPHRSLISGLRPFLCKFENDVLDIGAGSQFYRNLLPQEVNYRALELVPNEKVYGWENKSVDYYDGTKMPYDDESFDHVMCIEVLEHAENPELLLQEMVRVLKVGGTAMLTVPFAAKWHYVPYDYWRFTPSGLERLISNSTDKFRISGIYRRGGDVAVAFHMATVALVGLAFRKNLSVKLLGFLLAPVAVICGIIANISEIFDLGASENTLGYACLLEKKSNG